MQSGLSGLKRSWWSQWEYLLKQRWRKKWNKKSRKKNLMTQVGMLTNLLWGVCFSFSMSSFLLVHLKLLLELLHLTATTETVTGCYRSSIISMMIFLLKYFYLNSECMPVYLIGKPHVLFSNKLTNNNCIQSSSRPADYLKDNSRLLQLGYSLFYFV